MARPTVVIADDHAQMLRHVRLLLRGDFDVVAAVSNGRAAVDAATHLHPDVVVLDISMPILNGFDAAARLAELGSPSRVVFLSAHDDEAFVRTARNVGGCAYVLKADLTTRLVQAIRHALTRDADFLQPETSGRQAGFHA
jgi:two-component system nitrate/nitrite response regulator NarL